VASGLHAKAAGLSGDAADLAYLRFRQNVGLYQSAPITTDVFGLARTLAEAHGPTLLTRALDVLHVAIAVRYGAVAFGTFDRRQARLAEAVGLKILR
jgi:hypothetical protein